MRIFIGQYDRTIDSKNRIQIPAQLREAVDPVRDGAGFYITLGEFPRTLSIHPERLFEAMAQRIETEYMPGDDSRRFELQFYALASHVDMDSQGRIVLPDNLRRKARLDGEVCLVGQKRRVDVWNRADLDRHLGIDWEGDDWPDWQSFVRMRPGGPSGQGGDASASE